VTSIIENGATADTVNSDTIDEINGWGFEHAGNVAVKEAKLRFNDSRVSHPTYIGSRSKLHFGGQQRQQQILRKDFVVTDDCNDCRIKFLTHFDHSNVPTL
jgi:hypothetical protein